MAYEKKITTDEQRAELNRKRVEALQRGKLNKAQAATTNLREVAEGETLPSGDYETRLNIETGKTTTNAPATSPQPISDKEVTHESFRAGLEVDISKPKVAAKVGDTVMLAGGVETQVMPLMNMEQGEGSPFASEPVIEEHVMGGDNNKGSEDDSEPKAPKPEGERVIQKGEKVNIGETIIQSETGKEYDEVAPDVDGQQLSTEPPPTQSDAEATFDFYCDVWDGLWHTFPLVNIISVKKSEKIHSLPQLNDWADYVTEKNIKAMAISPEEKQALTKPTVDYMLAHPAGVLTVDGRFYAALAQFAYGKVKLVFDCRADAQRHYKMILDKIEEIENTHSSEVNQLKRKYENEIKDLKNQLTQNIVTEQPKVETAAEPPIEHKQAA